MTAVADTSPLLALARLDLLHLVPDLLGDTLIPPAVLAEATERRPDAPGARAVRQAVADGTLRVAEPGPATVSLSAWFGAGERDAVSLALSVGAEWLLLDDRGARRHAASLGLPVIGTVRLLETARDAGRLGRVAPLLEQLLSDGFRLSDDLIESVRAAETDLDV